MSAPRILLTGATGFVGAQVLANLPKDVQITPISRSHTDLLTADACKNLIAETRPTHLIHTAWETTHGVFWESPNNQRWLEAGKALFTAFVDAGGQRIVGLGSCAEYGADRDYPIKEDDVKQTPATTYGRAKLEMFQFLQTLPVSQAWARIFLAYGPSEGAARFVPSVINAVSAGKPARCSSGKQVRDFMDVRDLGRAIAQLASADVEGAINLGQGQSVSIGEVAKKIGALGKRPELIELGALPDRAGEQPVLVPDITRQTNELGFEPAISLDQGLRDAMDWWAQEEQKN